MRVYIYDIDGFLAGEMDVDPMGPLPSRSTSSPPPEVSANQVACFVGNQWVAIEEADAKRMKDERLVLQEAEQAQFVRQQRTDKLKSSDWTQLPDAPVNQQAWANYRQQLRDVTAQAGFPWTIEWPTQPE